MSDRLPFEDHLSKDIIYEVGTLILMAARAEAFLSFMVSRFINNDSRLVPLLDGMQTKIKLKSLQDLLIAHAGHEKTRAAMSVCEKLRKRFDVRNDIAHGTLAPGKTPNQLQILHLEINRKPGPRIIKTTSLAQIRETTLSIYNLVGQLNAEIDKLGLPSAFADDEPTPPRSAG